MSQKRKVELFSAGCGICEDAERLLRNLACPSCDVIVHDMHDEDVAARARQLGVRSVPAVVVDGALVPCCSSAGPDAEALRAAGIGQPLG